MLINEIFCSVQGEGTYMGVPSIFIRTQGCSLRCAFCDSVRTWDTALTLHKEMDFMDLWREVKKWKPRNIVFTGGEPTEQKDLYTIVGRFKMEGYRCQLETNGTNEVCTGYFQHVVCSPKPANNYRFYRRNVDELKFVVNKEFYENSHTYIDAKMRDIFEHRIWLQPMDEGSNESIIENANLCYALAMKDPRLRVGIQMHKVFDWR